MQWPEFSARTGKIKEFTGISDRYETPENLELRIDSEGREVDACANQVVLQPDGMGLITD